MNRKRLICGIIAASMLMSINAYAGMNSKVKGSISSETKVAGSNSFGVTQTELESAYDLTIDTAVTNAIAYSRDLKNLEDNIDITKDSNRATHSAWQVAEDFASNHSLSVQLRQLTTALSTYSANQEIAKQKIEYNVRTIFYNIFMAEKSLALYDQQIDINERQLKIYETMLNLGKLSQVEYNNYKYEFDKLVSDKTATETQISSAYRSLNQLMGKDLNQQYNIIVDDLTFEDMGEVSLDYEINKALSTNQTVKSAQDAVNIAKYDIDNYIDGSVESAERTQKQKTYEQSTRTLDDTKTNLKASMTALYDDILEAERKYKNYVSELATMEAQLKVKETQFSLGKITQLELDAYKLSIDSLKYNMESSTYSHDILVREFQNSDLIM